MQREKVTIYFHQCGLRTNLQPPFSAVRVVNADERQIVNPKTAAFHSGRLALHSIVATVYSACEACKKTNLMI